MKSELELLVEYDMRLNGYDPLNAYSVKAYWEMMLA